jgi:hypothetical protein
VRRLSAVLFLATLALLPWGGLLRLPSLHENAQWGDLVCAAAVAAWLVALVVARRLPRLRLVHAFLALYLGWAAFSFFAVSPRPVSGAAKLVGMGMLVALFVLTSEMMEQAGMAVAVGRTVAVTSVLTALAAAAGVMLSVRGIATPLVGGCGDLLPAIIPRAQAGFPHPNLLASFCIFASGVVAREDAGLSRGLVRVVQVALALTVVLTTSRAIFGFALAVAIRHATTPARRRAAWAFAASLVVAMAALSAHNPLLNPLRPWEARLSPAPSARAVAAATSLETLGRHPFFGTGPGSSPGFRGFQPFDAHLTPLNVAATLGLPALAGLVLATVALWRGRRRPTDAVTWGMLAGLGLDGLGQDVEDFRHVWVALGLADAGRRGRT